MSDTPTTISASRVPAVLGMDSRCSPLTLFLRLRGDLPETYVDDDVAVQQGRYYEKATAQWACDAYGMQLVEGFEQKTLTAGVLSGHPDFLAIDEDGKLVILEVKNPFWSYGGEDWGPSGSDQVPRSHFVQSLIYCHLFREWYASVKEAVAALVRPGSIATPDPAPDHHGLYYWDDDERWHWHEPADYAYVVAKLSGGIERFKIPYDEAIVSKLIGEVQMFLTRVTIDDPPEPQDEQDIRNRWKVTPKKVATCNEDFVERLRIYRNLKAQEKQIADDLSETRAFILGFAQDAASIEYEDANGVRKLLATVGSDRAFDQEACLAKYPALLSTYPTLDTKRLAKEQRKVYEQFMKAPAKATEQKRVIRLKEENL